MPELIYDNGSYHLMSFPGECDCPGTSRLTQFVCWSACILGSFGAMAGIIYGLVKLGEWADSYHDVTLTYENANNAIVNGSLFYLGIPNPASCIVNAAWNLSSYILWSKDIVGDRYTFLGGIFGNSSDMVKERGLHILDQINASFPLKGLGYGVQFGDAIDRNAVHFDYFNLVTEGNPEYLSDCEQLGFFSQDSTEILDDIIYVRGSEATSFEAKSPNKNRYGFYANSDKQQPVVSVSDEEMANSVFAQSDVAKRLLRRLG